MVEYGEAFLEENARIVDAMATRMPIGAVALAEQMAQQAEDADEEELLAA